jgi:hypothetical protein
MERPVGAMPVPRTVTTRLALPVAGTAWLDPPGAARPAVTGARAWQDLTSGSQRDSSVMFGGGRAQLLLGYFTAPGSGPGPNGFQHVLAWVTYKQHVALSAVADGMVIGPTGGGPTSSTAPAPVCAFGATYSALDATTGEGMLAASG